MEEVGLLFWLVLVCCYYHQMVGEVLNERVLSMYTVIATRENFQVLLSKQAEEEDKRVREIFTRSGSSLAVSQWHDDAPIAWLLGVPIRHMFQSEGNKLPGARGDL
ncbi:hypothetical protein F4823DRAFT_571862, partial [Ustulina deusta]